MTDRRSLAMVAAGLIFSRGRWRGMDAQSVVVVDSVRPLPDTHERDSRRVR